MFFQIFVPGDIPFFVRCFEAQHVSSFANLRQGLNPCVFRSSRWWWHPLNVSFLEEKVVEPMWCNSMRISMWPVWRPSDTMRWSRDMPYWDVLRFLSRSAIAWRCGCRKQLLATLLMFIYHLAFCDQLLQFYSGDILILPKDTYNTDRSYNSEILPYSRGDCFRCFIARPGWAGSAIAVFRVDQGGSDGSRWKNSKEKAAVHPSLRFGHWVCIVPEVEEISLGSRCIGKLWSAEAQCNIPSMFLMPLLPECRIFGSRVWHLMIWGCPKFSIPDFANNIWDVRGPQVSNMFPLETHDIILIVSLMRWQGAGNIIVFPNDWWMPDPHMLAMPGTWHGIKMMWWPFQHANSLNKDTRWQRMLRHLF